MADGQDQVLCDSGERFRALLERYKLALAAGRTTVWEWDAATNTISTDEHILSEMLGFAVREGYTVTDWMTAVHPEDRDRVRAEWAAFIEGPADTAESEYRVVSDDGRVWWLRTRYVVSARENGRARRIVGVTADVTERKQAEEARRASEERYRAFFELTAVGATETRLPGGEYTRVNDAFCRMSGYSREELLSMRFSDLSLPDDLPPSLERFEQLSRGERRQYAVEKRFVRKDGVVRWIHIEISAMPADPGPPEYALSIIQDITERRRAVEALEAVNQRYKLATSAGRVAVWEWDAETNTATVEAESASGVPRFRGRVHRTPAEFFAALHPDDRDQVLAAFTPVTTGAADAAECEYRVVESDGTVSWLYTRCRVTEYRGERAHRVLGITIDVTARKEAEEARRLSEERYRAFFERSVVGVAEVDLVGGRYLRANDAYCQMLGYPRDELLQKSFMDITHPEDSAQDWEQFSRLVRGEIPGYRLEKRYVCKDGGVIWALLDVTLIRDGAGHPVSEFGLVLDITERKRAEQEIERLVDRLQQVQDEERRAIAQELHDQTAQALVASTLNLTELLQSHDELNDAVRSRVRESYDLDKQVLEEIRTLSYVLHPPLLDELGLASALASYVDGFSERSGIAVELTLPPSLERLAPELEMALFRVVQEGLTNIHRHAGSELASIHLVRDDGRLILTVADHGHGMPAGGQGASGEIQRVGVGITGMRQRLRQLGGHLDIVTSPTGTTMTAVVPWMGR